jgi:DNA-binding CsgD family transcriptional regulator
MAMSTCVMSAVTGVSMLSPSRIVGTIGGIDAAAARLTDTILGNDDQDLAETLREVASEIGVGHIAYARLSSNKSTDINQLAGIVTYSKLWQRRYFLKGYVTYDPVISYGRNADQPFDWANLPIDNPATKAFLADALNHSVGRNGLSIPLRGPRGVFALVSFSSDLPKEEWDNYKVAYMAKLKLLSVLIDSASHINFTLRTYTVHLSNREEQCLLWAARGKRFHEIAEILDLALGTVKTHLDAARHKLHCTNLPQAAAIAFATGAIPSQAL